MGLFVITVTWGALAKQLRGEIKAGERAYASGTQRARWNSVVTSSPVTISGSGFGGTVRVWRRWETESAPDFYIGRAGDDENDASTVWYVSDGGGAFIGGEHAWGDTSINTEWKWSRNYADDPMDPTGVIKPEEVMRDVRKFNREHRRKR